MDLQSIQAKLVQTVNSLGQNDSSVQVDWVGGHQLTEVVGPRQNTPRPAEFSAAVDALQWRADQSAATGRGPAAHISSGNSVPGAVSTVPPEVYLKRLNAMADKVNHLSAEQERAISEMQAIQARLTHLRPQFLSQGRPAVPPLLDFTRAVIAAAEVDTQGNIVLSYRTVAADALPSPERHPPEAAQQLATHLRNTYGQPPTRPKTTAWGDLVNDMLALAQEPMHLLSSLGRALVRLTVQTARVILSPRTNFGTGAERPTRNGYSAPGLTLTDGVIWFGGGVIGRLALNLLLAAFPALWSVAVAAMTAMTAYALYRATLAPKLAFGPAMRVFLLVVGLVVGGQI